MLHIYILYVMLWWGLLGFFAYAIDQKHSKKALALWLAGSPFVFAPVVPSLVWLWLPPLMALWLVGAYSLLAAAAFFAVTVKT